MTTTETRAWLHLSEDQPKPRAHIASASKYHGVTLSRELDRHGPYWMVRLYVGENGVVYLGRHRDEMLAALHWDTAIRMIYDAPKYLNFQERPFRIVEGKSVV